MPMMAKVKHTVENDASTVVSAVRQFQAPGPFQLTSAHKLRQRMTRRSTTSQVRLVQVVPIAIAAGATVVVVAAGVVMSHFLVAREEGAFTLTRKSCAWLT
jgi:hypothetical protein